MALAAVTADRLNLEALTSELTEGAEGDGAVATFAGLVRNHNQGRTVRFLEYEAYEPLAVRALARIVDEARDLWPGARLAVHHRIGRLEIGDELSAPIANDRVGHDEIHGRPERRLPLRGRDDAFGFGLLLRGGRRGHSGGQYASHQELSGVSHGPKYSRQTYTAHLGGRSDS